MSAQTHAGRVKEITATSNPIVKEIKGLALKKNRDAEGLFIAEGLQLVTFALESGWRARSLIYAKRMAGHEHLMQVAAKARAAGTDILEVSEKVLGVIARRDNPQMVIGVFEQQWHDPLTIAKSAGKPGNVIVALDRVRDPGNLGTIIRTADAVGASAVLLVGECTDPYSMEAVRATMGSVFNVRLARTDAIDFDEFKAAFPGRIAGTHLGGSVDYRSIAYGSDPWCLLMGNEQQGLPSILAEACDSLVHIPMAGRAESLNLAIATGVMLFEMRRDHLTMGETASDGGKQA